MALFSGLSEKLNHIFSKIKSKGKLTELEIKQAMREIRIALLEADVNFTVVKDFVAKVSEKAVGEEVLKSLTPGQQVVKIVNDELIVLMGSTKRKTRSFIQAAYGDNALRTSGRGQNHDVRKALPSSH